MRFPSHPPVTFAAVVGTRAAAKALARELRVAEFHRLRRRRMGVERALQQASELEVEGGFPLSPGRLREWVRRHRRAGLNGLVDQKRGIVGRRSVWAMLTPAQRAALLAGRVVLGNFSAAFRALARRRDLPPEARAHIRADLKTIPASIHTQGRWALALLRRSLTSPNPRPARRRPGRRNRRRPTGPAPRRPHPSLPAHTAPSP